MSFITNHNICKRRQFPQYFRGVATLAEQFCERFPKCIVEKASSTAEVIFPIKIIVLTPRQVSQEQQDLTISQIIGTPNDL